MKNLIIMRTILSILAMALVSLVPFQLFAQTNTFPSSGSVGIGTLAPGANLHIKADQPNAVSLIIENGASNIDYTAANLLFKSTGSPGNRGMGMFFYDNSTQKEWYFGSPYTHNDALIIARQTSVSTLGYTTAQYPNALMIISSNGNVGIGTITPAEKLSVNGTIRSKEVKVETANWPDYVFEEDYKIGKLEDLENYIKVNKHLPGIPSAKEVGKEGVSIGEMNAKLLEKIEELTLQMIQLRKELDEVKGIKKRE